MAATAPPLRTRAPSSPSSAHAAAAVQVSSGGVGGAGWTPRRGLQPQACAHALTAHARWQAWECSSLPCSHASGRSKAPTCTTLSTKNMSGGNFWMPIFLMGESGWKGSTLQGSPSEQEGGLGRCRLAGEWNQPRHDWKPRRQAGTDCLPLRAASHAHRRDKPPLPLPRTREARCAAVELLLCCWCAPPPPFLPLSPMHRSTHEHRAAPAARVKHAVGQARL